MPKSWLWTRTGESWSGRGALKPFHPLRRLLLIAHLSLSACLTTHGLGVPLCMTLCTGLDEKKALNFWDPRADTFVKSE